MVVNISSVYGIMRLEKSNNLTAPCLPIWASEGVEGRKREHRRGVALPNKYIDKCINKQSIRPLPETAETAPGALEDKSSFSLFLLSAACID